MTARTLKTFIVAALAGTSLSGCVVFGDATDVWSGTKNFAKFMMTPVGELLRPAPADEIQFASVETEVTETVVMNENVETTQSTKTVKSDTKIVTSEMTDVSVSETQVANAVAIKDREATGWRTLDTKSESHATMNAARLPATNMTERATTQTETVTTVTQMPSSTTQTVSYNNGIKTETVTESFGTVVLDDSRSLRVMEGNEASYIHMEGAAASLGDWRRCEESAGGYWTFDGVGNAGRLNPAFERCMSSQDYQMKTTIKTEVLPATTLPVIVTSQSTLP